ncbi:MAG: hypothetical protein FWG93_07925 [Oscillospiraceae bacterium]|nr:hypothetical protein [Oscillospiraceae bacterium]
MNKNRFRSDMEAAWELRPHTDGTPESRSHTRRFSAPAAGGPRPGKDSAKNREKPEAAAQSNTEAP